MATVAFNVFEIVNRSVIRNVIVSVKLVTLVLQGILVSQSFSFQCQARMRLHFGILSVNGEK